MAYNHAKEEKKFKEQWEQKEKLYLESGMTAKQISVIREFDENAFKLDRAFYRRTMLLAEPESITEGKLDDRSESLNYRIRNNLKDNKVPYVLVVGDKEIENNTVSVRQRGVGEIGTMPFDEFMNLAKEQIKTKKC